MRAKYNETKKVNKINLQIRNVQSAEYKIQINDASNTFEDELTDLYSYRNECMTHNFLKFQIQLIRK